MATIRFEIKGFGDGGCPALRADRDQTDKKVTPDQSKRLKIGTRVCFNGDQTDRGKVTAIQARYVTIGEASSVSHNDMAKVERVLTRK
jgi:hypothetical protein